MKTIFAFLFLLSLQVLARPEITIAPIVEVSQRELLRLGDIASVKGGSEELLASLQNVVLRTDARELLLSQYLDSSEILGKLREALKADPKFRRNNPQLKVPSRVQVVFASVPVSKQEVERKVLNVLNSRCHECVYNVSIQSTPRPSGKKWDLDFSSLSGKGGFMLPLQDSEKNSIKWISGTIRVSRLTPVTTRLILQGERIQADDLQMSMMDVTFAKDGSLSAEDAQGQIAARTLSVGSAVWATDLKREPAAKRGQVVKALLGDENFEITVNMMAEENGFVGDMVKVKNLETKKILSGVVTEKGVVKLQ